MQTVKEFVVEESELLGQPPLNVTASSLSSYCHDNTWALAYAINDTLNSKYTIKVNVKCKVDHNNGELRGVPSYPQSLLIWCKKAPHEDACIPVCGTGDNFPPMEKKNPVYNVGLNDSAINEDIVQAIGTDSPFRLEDFSYDNYKVLEIMFEHLQNTMFDGLSVNLAIRRNYQHVM